MIFLSLTAVWGDFDHPQFQNILINKESIHSIEEDRDGDSKANSKIYTTGRSYQVFESVDEILKIIDGVTL